MIGIFDSGIGGLTVVKQIFKILPQYKIVYFGDTARLPYGTKSEEMVIRYSIQNTKFLLEEGSKIIVIACHTASSIAAEVLQKNFFGIPIFDVVKPGLRKALSESAHGRIGIIGTAGTIKSKTHENFLKKLDPKIKVYSHACPLLVPLVEEGWLARQETRKIVRFYLKPLKEQRIDTLVLACTHYPLLRNTILDILGAKVKIIDPAEEVALHLKEFLEKNKKIRNSLTSNEKDHKFFVSDTPYRFGQTSQRILKKAIKIEKVTLD
jgi:glutamate racemase